LGAAAAIAVVAGSSAGANATATAVTSGSNIDPTVYPIDTVEPISVSGGATVRLGDAEPGAGWDPYGQGANPAPDTTHYWVDVPDGGSATFSFSSEVTTFGFVWGSPDYPNSVSNQVQLYDSGTPVGSYSSVDLYAAYPSLQNSQMPGYWVVLTSMTPFNTAVFSENQGGDFEFAIPTAVPEAATWAMILAGFVGLGAAGATSRRRSTPRYAL